MSRAASPFAGRLYGVVRVTREWEMARSSLLLSAPHRRATPASAAAARTEDGVQRRDIDRKIREVLAASPFYGEGHRKVWARLRFQEVRTSKARVLRLMRQAQFLRRPFGLPTSQG